MTRMRKQKAVFSCATVDSVVTSVAAVDDVEMLVIPACRSKLVQGMLWLLSPSGDTVQETPELSQGLHANTTQAYQC